MDIQISKFFLKIIKISRSNMKSIKATNISEDLVLEEFETSVKMSTYLLAFLVADFDITTQEKDYNILHMHGKGEQAKLAADIGPKIRKHQLKHCISE